MQLDKRKIQKFQKEIREWYKVNKRDLPWRKTRDPYKILVSEIMLQQTQVSRVITKYEAWLEAFPTVEALAKAKKEDVLRLWSGLGYNRRALYLQRTAQAVLELRSRNYELRKNVSGKRGTSASRIKKDQILDKTRTLDSGQARNVLFDHSNWPQTIGELEKFPGIGPYTARAIACFAFHQQVAVVDANVRKIILLKFRDLLSHPDRSRFIGRVEGSPIGKVKKDSSTALGMTNSDLQLIADQLLPIGQAYDWNQALMDYSSLVLQKEKVQIKRQPAFKNSNRFYRGKLLRVLLEQKNLRVDEVGYILKDDYNEKDETWKETLLRGLEKDGILRIKDGRLSVG